MRPVTATALGVAAAAAAALLGASPWLAAAAALLLLLPRFMPRAAGLVAVAAAPILATATLPVQEILAWELLAALAVAAALWAPLFVHLGGGVPWQATPWTTGAALLLVAAVLLTPPGAALQASDVAGRAQTLLLAAAAIVVFAVAPAVRPRRAARDAAR